MAPKLRDDGVVKKKEVILSRSTSGKDFVQWRTNISTILNAEAIPKEYYLIEKLSEQLFSEVKAPVQSSYATAAAPSVSDKEKYVKEKQKWNLVEGIIRKVVTDRLDGTTLKSKFNEAESCYLGWRALTKEVNFDRSSRSELLLQQLNSFRQQEKESDLDYADRMQELVSRLTALDYPDRTNPVIAEAHDLIVAQKFRLGFRESRFVSLTATFRNEGIDKSFDNMRGYIVKSAQELELSRAQRQQTSDDDTDRALAVKGNESRTRKGNVNTAYRATKSNDPNKLFVGNLAWKVTDKTLTDMFKKFGTVTDAFVVMSTDESTPRSRGFGFVTLSSQAETAAAIAELDGKEIDGRPLVVNHSKNRPGPATGSSSISGQARKTSKEEEDDKTEDLPAGY
ncbi:hypothetical protein HDU67_002421, partial [Dinochytrium kinnereticum]